MYLYTEIYDNTKLSWPKKSQIFWSLDKNKDAEGTSLSDFEIFGTRNRTLNKTKWLKEILNSETEMTTQSCRALKSLRFLVFGQEKEAEGSSLS